MLNVFGTVIRAAVVTIHDFIAVSTIALGLSRSCAIDQLCDLGQGSAQF